MLLTQIHAAESVLLIARRLEVAGSNRSQIPVAAGRRLSASTPGQPHASRGEPGGAAGPVIRGRRQGPAKGFSPRGRRNPHLTMHHKPASGIDRGRNWMYGCLDDQDDQDDQDELNGLRWKTRTLVEWAAGRPFARGGDEVTDTDRAWVATRQCPTAQVPGGRTAVVCHRPRVLSVCVLLHLLGFWFVLGLCLARGGLSSTGVLTDSRRNWETSTTWMDSLALPSFFLPLTGGRPRPACQRSRPVRRAPHPRRQTPVPVPVSADISEVTARCE